MGWALYEVEKHETYAGEYTVERLLRVEATLDDAIEQNAYSVAVIREVPNMDPTPMCACGDRLWHDGRHLRCYECRASRPL